MKWGAMFLLLAMFGCKGENQTKFEAVAAQYESAQTAAKQAGVPLRLKELAPSPLSESEDAAPILNLASTELVVLKGGRAGSLADAPSLIRSGDFAGAQAAINAQAKALSYVEQACKKERADFGRDWETDRPWAMMFPEYADLRAFAKAITARAVLRARSGDNAGALADIKAGFRLGEFASSDPFLIAALVRIAIDSITARQVEWMLTVSPKDISMRQSLQDVMKAQPEDLDFTQTMRGEAIFSIAAAEAWAKMTPGEMEEMLAEGSQKVSKATAGISKDLASRAFTTRAMQIWTEAFEGLKQKQYEISPSEVLDRVLGKVDAGKDPTYALVGQLMPVFSQAGNAFVMRTARFRAVDGMLMAVSYWQSHGKMPESLEAAGFKGVDPFTGKPFRYKAQGDSLAVWSVGQDLKDDGGLEKENKDIVAQFPRE